MLTCSCATLLAIHCHTGGSPGLSKGALAGATSGALLAVLCVLLALFAMHWHRCHSQHRSILTGAVLAPPLGPQTTLLVSDVHAVNQMWEQLEPSIADACMALHDRILKKYAEQWSGYQCTQVGVPGHFVLAFHTALDAVSFARDVQLALLVAQWPDALLELEEGKAVAMQATVMMDAFGGGFAAARRNSVMVRMMALFVHSHC